MAKKVLIISTSLRGGSNSDILAKECAKGAKEAGHDVEFLSLKGKDIKYCIGCSIFVFEHKNGNVFLVYSRAL